LCLQPSTSAKASPIRKRKSDEHVANENSDDESFQVKVGASFASVELRILNLSSSPPRQKKVRRAATKKPIVVSDDSDDTDIDVDMDVPASSLQLRRKPYKPIVISDSDDNDFEPSVADELGNDSD